MHDTTTTEARTMDHKVCETSNLDMFLVFVVAWCCLKLRKIPHGVKQPLFLVRPFEINGPRAF